MNSWGAEGPIPLSLAILQESSEVLCVLAATWAMARIEKRPLLSFGYTGDHKLIRLVSGAMWGFACLSLLVGILWRAGLLIFKGQSQTGLLVWKFALAWGLVFLMVGVFEESLPRLPTVHAVAGIELLVGGIVTLGGIRARACGQRRRITPRAARSICRRFGFLPQPAVHEIAILGRGLPRGMGLGPILLLWNAGQRPGDEGAPDVFASVR
jgi:hypothetical protein